PSPDRAPARLRWRPRRARRARPPRVARASSTSVAKRRIIASGPSKGMEMNDAQAFDSPVEPPAGRSSRRERRWGLIGGLLGAGVGLASFLIAAVIQGEPLRDLSGSPYPPVFTKRRMMPLDY